MCALVHTFRLVCCGRWLTTVLQRLQEQPLQSHSLLHLGSIVLSAAALGQQLPEKLLDSILHRFCTHAQPSDHRQVHHCKPARPSAMLRYQACMCNL